MKSKKKVVILEKDGVVHVIPLKPIKDMRGFVKGMGTSDIRDENDRF